MANVRRLGWDLSGSNVARSLVALCFGIGVKRDYIVASRSATP
jgi:hypothetical protein